MDERQAFGVIAALGKALAVDPTALGRLRAAASPAALAELVRAAPSRLPQATVDTFAHEHAGLATWEKTRAKLILAVQLAQGKVARKPGHEEKGGVKGHP